MAAVSTLVRAAREGKVEVGNSIYLQSAGSMGDGYSAAPYWLTDDAGSQPQPVMCASELEDYLDQFGDM